MQVEELSREAQFRLMELFHICEETGGELFKEVGFGGFQEHPLLVEWVNAVWPKTAENGNSGHEWVAAAPACQVCKLCGVEKGDAGTDKPCNGKEDEHED